MFNHMTDANLFDALVATVSILEDRDWISAEHRRNLRAGLREYRAEAHRRGMLPW